MIVEHFKNTKWLVNQITFSEIGKFIYMKPAKCAGTSIFRKTLQRDVPDALCRKDNAQKHEAWLNNLTDEQVINDYFKFTFVRNPYDRIVSAYVHIILGNQGRNISFEEFVKYHLVDGEGYPLHDHWLPQHLHTYCNGIQFVDYIGNVETLDKDWKFVADKIGVCDVLPYFRWPAPPRKNDYREYYTNTETIETVSKVYKKDIELFNYEF